MNFPEKITNHLSKNQYTWLITGVAGFIGSNLMEQLLLLEQKVRGLDNFFSGFQRNIDDVLLNIPKKYHKNFIFYEGDIRNVADCNEAVSGVDYILNHAALCSVPQSLEDPVLTSEINNQGFVNILSAAKNAQVKRVIYASSSAVYGDADGSITPRDENDKLSFLSPYAASKYINEIQAKFFSTCYNLETVGLRYFNVYGKRQDPSGAYAAVIPIWTNALAKNKEAFINGDGETTRDFCYIADIVQANLLAAISDHPCVAEGVVCNIGSGSKVTLNELFKNISSFVPGKNSASPLFREFRIGDIRYSVASIEYAKKILGFVPLYNLKSGLQITVPWYIKNV